MAFSSGNTGVGNESGAESGAVGARKGVIPPDLAVVVEAWPNLPETVRRNILGTVREAVGVMGLDEETGAGN